ncbi:MAG: hypothetical protein ACOZF0_11290 [Thermodesulfobacteriota bacterium]
MNKKEILEHLETGLSRVLFPITAPDDRRAVSMAIKFFIIENAGRFSASELMSRFSTMEKGLVLFLQYLESDQMPKSTTIH